ncbi:unnamed protein product [Urochloa humidicola]
MVHKRRDREFTAAAEPPAKRLHLQVAGAGGPPSPRLRRAVLVLLFVIRTHNKDKSVDNNDSAPVTRAEIRRIVAEQVGICLEPIVRTLKTIKEELQDRTQNDNLALHKLEGIEQGIQAFTQTMIQEGAKCSCPNQSNHVQFTQEENHHGTSAEAEGLASNGGDGKSSAQLLFLNELKTPIYHDDEIKSESDAAIKIGIFDGDKMIESGPLSNVKVEVLALEGDFPYDAQNSWTAKEFNEHIARGREGKGDVLAGEGTTGRLINGERDLGSIRFREGSSRARKGKFIIGVRVCGGQAIGGRVQEAVMKPVVVQVSRNRQNKKNHPPKLKDEVHRLEEIAKDGTYQKRLEENDIFTVQDFLKALNKDPDNLATILKIKKEHKYWEKMTNHARECSLEDKHKLKSYSCTQKNVKLFFNCVNFLVGAIFDNHYTHSDKFNPAQKELVDELKSHAYTELDDLPEDHVMPDSSLVPVHIDTYAGVGAGPSYKSSVTLANCSSLVMADQVGGREAVEGLMHDIVEPSYSNVNNDPCPASSIPSLQRLLSYEVGGIHVPALEALSHARIDSFCANANSDPGPSSSVPDQLSTHNYREQGTLLVDVSQGPFGGRSFSFGTTDMSNLCRLVSQEDDILAFLQQQLYTSSCMVPGSEQMEIQGQLFCSQDNDTFEASTSAHINMTVTAQQLPIPDTPRSVDGSMQSQMQAPLPTSNGVPEAPASTQHALPPQQ